MLPNFTLPSSFAGEVRFAECNASTRCEWTKVLEKMKRDEVLKDTRAAAFGGCNLVEQDDALLTMLHETLIELTPLQTLSLRGCKLEGRQLEIVLPALLQLDQFAIQSTDRTRAAVLDLSGNVLDSTSFLKLCKRLGQKLPDSDKYKVLRGVRRLMLSETQVDDDALCAIPTCFPNLEELHLSETRVNGQNCHRLLNKMPALRLLNIDDTDFDGTGAGKLYTVMRNLRQSPLQVWARGCKPLDEGWINLLDLCSNKRTKEHFELKHDLLMPGTNGNAKNDVQVHESFLVRLYFNDVGSVDVEHRREISTKTVKQLAEEAVAEVNRVSKRDDSASNERKKRYRQAIEPLFKSGRLQHCRTFKKGAVYLATEGGDRDEPTLSQQMLGAPVPGRKRSLYVEIESA